ncbi:MAG TPA: hypothetical protein VGM50_14805 [Gemmatimonadaceae bacterium]
MFGSNIIDVLIGLIVVYLLMSLVATGVREALAGIFKTRAKFLALGMKELLGSGQLLSAFYEHPQIFALYEDQARNPSYIPASSFALALMDMAARGLDHNSTVQSGPEATPLTIDTIRRNIGGLRDTKVQRMVLSALDTAGGDLAKAQQSLQRWFDSAMDRVSGRYRRRTSMVLFAVGLITAIVINVDTIEVGTSFYKSPALREAAVAMAGHLADTTSRAPGDTSARVMHVDSRGAIDSLYALKLPIGWTTILATSNPIVMRSGVAAAITDHVLHSFFGWLLTAIAISLGAPFWFDMLNRFMVIRSTVKPHEKSPEEGSADRGAKPTPSPVPPLSMSLAPSPAAPAPAQIVVVTAPAANGGGADTSPPPDEPHEWASGDPQGGVL